MSECCAPTCVHVSGKGYSACTVASAISTVVALLAALAFLLPCVLIHGPDAARWRPAWKDALTDSQAHAHVPDWLDDSLNRDRSGPHNYWFVLIVFPLGAAAVLCFLTVACCVKDCSANSGTAGAVGLVRDTPIMVTVPAGAKAGQTLQLNHPRTGQLLSVVVPPGLVRSAIAGALLRPLHPAVRES
jgi:hypothetical protein|eukprot:COSAG03_NODE_666_length_6376_cov_2.241995_7_plen_187_part_00